MRSNDRLRCGAGTRTAPLGSAAGLVLLFVVSACGTSHTSLRSHLPTTTRAPPATTTTTAPPAASSSTTITSSLGGFTAAKQQWVQGASAISADQGTYFLQAAADLTKAIAEGGVNVSQYQSAVMALKSLALLPETSDTPQQMAEAHSDLVALNAFFGTTGLYE
jgi:hypothetical protein